MMAQWIRRVLAGLGLAGASVGAVIWLGSNRWENRTGQLAGKLFQPIQPAKVKRVSLKDFDQLPPPVATYFRLALREGQPVIRSARLTQVGGFRLREADGGWSPFTATQYFAAQPPGFVWDATIRMAPFLNVRVRDSYLAGQGSMQGKILALLPVLDARSRPELNEATLQRYLAEAVWLPTALLPGGGVTWSGIDNRTALATLTDSGTSASLEFQFNALGEITAVSTSGRYREVNGQYELTPWTGRFRRYEERGGICIPVEAEVAWQLPGGMFTYWQGRIIDVAYDFSR
jgi:hypothetical protein